MSNTKNVTRFYTPIIQEKTTILAQWKEKLEIESKKAWEQFMSQFPYEKFQVIVENLAVLDCIASLAECSKKPGYVKPQIGESNELIITEGRNPIVEQLRADTYIPNDTNLNKQHRCMIITGPNTGGKSSYLRQVALLSIMAQIGSFVPCTEMKFTPFDAIFTRMGAYDNLISGESTFFVELSQTSQILKDVTNKSLVILDELGRGTSETDGESIACSVLKALLSINCFVLFVTHYTSLTTLEQDFKDIISNFHMSYIETKDDGIGNDSIVFLYKLALGPAKQSFGLNCAKLAGIPKEVVEEASTKVMIEQYGTHLHYTKIREFYEICNKLQ